MNARIQQLDFLKCVCILLMVMFHLVFIGEKFPYAKQVVYTFHMPVFLIISGYLVHTQRPLRRFLTAQWWIFVPYLVLELPYLVLSGMMGVRSGETDLSPLHLAYRVLADPIGPYWYLHTLLVCNLTLWGVRQLLQRFGWKVQLGGFAVALIALVAGTGLVADNVMYYFFGVAIAQSGTHFLQIFHPSLPALLLGGLLCCFPANLHYAAPGGVAITYFFINFMLWIYDRRSPQQWAAAHFIGRNTLTILLFSPIFTMLAKPLVPVLSFDPTGMIFLLTATTAAVAGSLGIARIMDCARLSRWFCGRPNLLLRAPQN